MFFFRLFTTGRVGVVSLRSFVCRNYLKRCVDDNAVGDNVPLILWVFVVPHKVVTWMGHLGLFHTAAICVHKCSVQGVRIFSFSSLFSRQV